MRAAERIMTPTRDAKPCPTFVLSFNSGDVLPLVFVPVAPKLGEGSAPSQRFKKVTIGAPSGPAPRAKCLARQAPAITKQACAGTAGLVDSHRSRQHPQCGARGPWPARRTGSRVFLQILISRCTLASGRANDCCIPIKSNNYISNLHCEFELKGSPVLMLASSAPSRASAPSRRGVAPPQLGEVAPPQ